jgi:hypothetical protein
LRAPADFDDLWAKDRQKQGLAFTAVLAETVEPVDWAYVVWDDLVAHLASEDNHDRAIAAQVLCRLAKSDPDSLLDRDFDALFAITRDERFVTARHSLLAMWQVGVAGPWQRERLLGALRDRFSACSIEKNCTLIRYDIAVVLKRVYDITADESARELALALIDAEPDAKYRKKYASAWK